MTYCNHAYDVTGSYTAFRLPWRCKWNLGSPEMLRSVDC